MRKPWQDLVLALLLLAPSIALAHGAESAAELYYAAIAVGGIGAIGVLCFIKQPWWVKLLLFLPLVIGAAFAMFFLIIAGLIVFKPFRH